MIVIFCKYCIVCEIPEFINHFLVEFLGEKENPLMPLEETLRILSICEEIRRQIGVVYDDDKE